MVILGITGGIGSGKSTLSRLFEMMGIPVYISDTEAKRLMNESVEIRKNLTDKFGENVYSGNTLNRKELASLIFNNPDAVSYVNSVVHPAVQADFLSWTKTRSESLIAIESAILFESGFDALADFTVAVSAPLNVRIERITQRDQATEDEVTARINNQMPEAERNRRADFVLINDEQKAMIPQAEKLINKLKFGLFS